MARLFLRYVDDGLVLGMSAWPSWALRPKEPHGFRGRKAILNHAHARKNKEKGKGLTLGKLSLICQPTSEDMKQHLKEGSVSVDNGSSS